MKLPHISIEYKEEETFAPDTVSLSLIFGFGLHWAWVWLVMFNGPVLLYQNHPELFSSVFAATLLVFTLSLSCYGVFLQQFRTLFSTRGKRLRNRAIATVLVLVGTSLLWSLQTNLPATAIVGASALCNGIGSAVLLMSFGVSSSVLDIAEAVTCAAMGFAVGALVFVLIMLVASQFPFVGALCCLALLPLEFICLWQCSKHLVDNMEFSTSTLSVHTVPFALHVCGPMVVFGFILGFLRPLSLLEIHVGHSFFSMAAAYALAGIAVAALALGAMVMQRQRNNFMFRTLLPVCALLLGWVSLSAEQPAELTAFCLFTSYVMIEACSWVMLSDISQRYRLSAFTVFGFGRGALALGALIGFFAIGHTPEGGGYLAQIQPLTILSLALLLFGMALLPKSIELRNTLKLGKNCPALQGDEQFLYISTEEFSQAKQPHPSDTTARFEEANHHENEAESAHSNTRAPEEVNDARESFVDEAHKEALDAMQELVDAEEKEKQRQGRFKRKCAAVADTYLLSRKETEVLFLLAKGRNAAAIQEQLYISAGTANTHMRHIYRKLNVHSQQDLIALVEETEVDNINWDK